MSSNILIVGGTSGLGLSLASLFAAQACKVYVTGRKNPNMEGLHFIELELDTDSLAVALDNVLFEMPYFDLVVYSAGFYQEARIGELSDGDIMKMERVGLLAPVMLMSRLIRRQKFVPTFIAVTSTSQWTPRKLEPVYCATKAGLGMFAHVLSLDESVGKILVIGVAGMGTPFWKAENRDISTMLDPEWVAEKIIEELQGYYAYKLIKVLRTPARVEIAEIE